MIKPYYQDERYGITIYCGDSYEILPQLENVEADLLLSDPPWGSGLSMSFNERFTHSAGSWWKNTDRSICPKHEPVYGDNKPFDPAPFLDFPEVILWGAQWYSSKLPDSGGWLVWDKRHKVEDADWPMSDAELAWTNIGKAVKIFRHMWFGLLRESEKGQFYHLTQKPVALMLWCLGRSKTKGPIVDPFMGCGPSLIAAKKLSREAIGIDIEEKYCEIAVRRLSQDVFQWGQDGQA